MGVRVKGVKFPIITISERGDNITYSLDNFYGSCPDPGVVGESLTSGTILLHRLGSDLRS